MIYKLAILLAIPFFQIGCAGTMLYSTTTGKPLAHFSSDMDESEYSGGGVYWKVKNHYPSKVATAHYNGASKLTGAVAAGTTMLLLR